jgi:hypothetical protein
MVTASGTASQRREHRGFASIKAMLHKSGAAKYVPGMNLLYLAGSLIGVAMIVGLNLVLFGRPKPALGNLQKLGALIAADIPGFNAGGGIIGNDGSVALVTDGADNTIFLIKALGDRVVTRKLSRGALRAVSTDGSTLSLQLRDYTLPTAQIALDSEATARDWESRLNALAA